MGQYLSLHYDTVKQQFLIFFHILESNYGKWRWFIECKPHRVHLREKISNIFNVLSSLIIGTTWYDMPKTSTPDKYRQLPLFLSGACINKPIIMGNLQIIINSVIITVIRHFTVKYDNLQKKEREGGGICFA